MAGRLYVRGWVWEHGGQAHEGWIPAGAAVPLPSPAVRVPVNLEVVPESGGWLLTWELASSTDTLPDSSLRSGDTWHDSVDDALQQAEVHFGVPRSSWTELGEGGRQVQRHIR